MERYSAPPRAGCSARIAEFRYERLIASRDYRFADLKDLGTAPGKTRKREWSAIDDQRTAVGAHMLAQLGVRHDALDRLLDRDRIAEANRKARVAISDDVNRAFFPRRDDRGAEEHRLEEHDAESF